MKRTYLWSISVLGLSALLALSGCNALFDDESVIGPDLDQQGPFGEVQKVVMTETFTYQTDNAPDQQRTRRITITHAPGGDAGTLINVFGNTQKPFLAGISYQSFTPVVAETNADAKTYWLIGFNATRTPDRSTYIVLRYPKGIQITPGTQSDVDYMTLTCEDLKVARLPADYWKPQPANASATPEPAPNPAPEADPCELNSRAEADKLVPLALKRYDEIKHYDGAPDPGWQKLHIELE